MAAALDTAWHHGDVRYVRGLRAMSLVGIALLATTTGQPTARAAGKPHAGISSGYAVDSWGWNALGVLGDKDAAGGVSMHTPVQVALPPSVRITQISASARDVLALTSTGAVYAWGSDANDELGTNVHPDEPEPVPFPPGTVVTDVAADESHSLAVTSTGAVYGWGLNSYGMLGQDPDIAAEPAPILITPAPSAVAVAAGYHDSFVLTASGEVYGFGDNQEGSLGIGTRTGPTFTPTQLTFPNAAAIAKVSASGGDGYSVAFAVSTDGHLYSWGSSINGVLGDGDQTNAVADTPVAVDLPTSADVTEVSAFVGAGAHALALTSDGTAYAWGDNFWAQLGDGTVDSNEHVVPVAVTMPAGVRFAAVSAGDESNAAVSTTGMVYTWGAGPSGQLGNGSNATVLAPTKIAMPQQAPAYAVASSSDADLALVSPEPPPSIRPVVNGLPRVANRLSCAASRPVPIGSVASWRWRSGTTQVATTKAYTVRRADHGQLLTCALHLNDGYGTASRTSAAVVPTWQTTLTAQRQPTLSGAHQVGSSERVNRGRWTPHPTAWHYQWYLGSTALRGATRRRLTVPKQAAGRTIRCQVVTTRRDDNPGRAITSTVAVRG
jgi:alpha-tubulin suppressor-like RCC1 family protein